MNSLKTEFREHFFFYEKHLGFLPIVILFVMMPPLFISGPFSDASLSGYANYSTSLDDTSLILLAFAFLTILTQFSIVLTSFMYACTMRFEISPYSKIKAFVDFWKIYSHKKKEFTSNDISSAASELPKYSENDVNDILKESAKKDKEIIKKLKKENKELRDRLSDNDK